MISMSGREAKTSGISRPQASSTSPWSLRSYYRQSSQYHRGVSASAASIRHVDSIFTKNANVGSNTLTGTIDGQEVTFELLENINSRPATRQKPTFILENMTGSALETRLRWYIMRYSLLQITILYFAMFLGINFLFAGLWSIQEGKCCDNNSLSFAQIFDFAVQTSATIGYGGKPLCGATMIYCQSVSDAYSYTHTFLVQRIRSAGLLRQFPRGDDQPSDNDAQQCIWRTFVAEIHCS